MFREAKQALERERGEKLDEDAALDALCRALLSDRASRSDRSGPGDDADSLPRGSEVRSNASDGAPYRVTPNPDARITPAPRASAQVAPMPAAWGVWS